MREKPLAVTTRRLDALLAVSRGAACPEDIAYVLGVGYTRAVVLSRDLRRMGLAYREDEGKPRALRLTEKGAVRATLESRLRSSYAESLLDSEDVETVRRIRLIAPRFVVERYLGDDRELYACDAEQAGVEVGFGDEDGSDVLDVCLVRTSPADAVADFWSHLTVGLCDDGWVGIYGDDGTFVRRVRWEDGEWVDFDPGVKRCSCCGVRIDSRDLCDVCWRAECAPYEDDPDGDGPDVPDGDGMVVSS